MEANLNTTYSMRQIPKYIQLQPHSGVIAPPELLCVQLDSELKINLWFNLQRQSPAFQGNISLISTFATNMVAQWHVLGLRLAPTMHEAAIPCLVVQCHGVLWSLYSTFLWHFILVMQFLSDREIIALLVRFASYSHSLALYVTEWMSPHRDSLCREGAWHGLGSDKPVRTVPRHTRVLDVSPIHHAIITVANVVACLAARPRPRPPLAWIAQPGMLHLATRVVPTVLGSIVSFIGNCPLRCIWPHAPCPLCATAAWTSLDCHCARPNGGLKVSTATTEKRGSIGRCGAKRLREHRATMVISTGLFGKPPCRASEGPAGHRVAPHHAPRQVRQARLRTAFAWRSHLLIGFAADADLRPTLCPHGDNLARRKVC